MSITCCTTETRDHILRRIHVVCKSWHATPIRCSRRLLLFLILPPPLTKPRWGTALHSTRAHIRETWHSHVVVIIAFPSVSSIWRSWRLLASTREVACRITWPLACPEARRVVVTRAGEQVAQWMEGERPDVTVMCLRECCARSRRCERCANR